MGPTSSSPVKQQGPRPEARIRNARNPILPTMLPLAGFTTSVHLRWPPAQSCVQVLPDNLPMDRCPTFQPPDPRSMGCGGGSWRVHRPMTASRLPDTFSISTQDHPFATWPRSSADIWICAVPHRLSSWATAYSRDKLGGTVQSVWFARESALYNNICHPHCRSLT